MEDRERLKIVLKHLIEHNQGHLEDYTRWIELARGAGLGEVADLLAEAKEHVERAGSVLNRAIEAIDK